MKQCIVKHKKAITGSAAMLLVGLITLSFQQFPYAHNQFTGQQDLSYSVSCPDTLPDKEGIKMKDFDKLQVELEKAMGEVNAELKNLDMGKMQKEAMAQALKAADMDKAMQDVSLALHKIDLDKMMADVSASLKNVNQHFKSAEIEKALAEAGKEMEKAKLELKEVDKEAIQQEIAKAKIEIEKSKAEIEKIDMNKMMDEARAGINKAKDELKLTKEMLTEMEKEGLINSKAGFTVEYKNKELYIDGKKQDEKTTDKYRKYFKKEDFKINMNRE